MTDRKMIRLGIPLAVLAAAMLLELTAILVLNGGRLTYTLDDTYIHMALAENIARGHYGVNLGEASAPASSILWPILLAPFSLMGVDQVAPLGINILAAVATLVVAGRLWQTVLEDYRSPRRPFVIALMTTLTIFFANLLGLIFLGMEHGLQVWLAMLILLGLIKELEHDRLDWWLLPAIVCASLIRYESLALGLPALLFLFLRGHRLAAFATFMTILLLLATFSLGLITLGLRPMPTSIQSRSSLLASTTRPSVLLHTLRDALNDRRGILLASTLVFLLYPAISRQSKTGARLLTGAVGLAVLLHLFAGGFGGWHRYEIYIWVVSVAAILYLYRAFLVSALNREGMMRFATVAITATVIWNAPYLKSMLAIPLAANNIYEQQYQMHRFAVDYLDMPVAINDLGYVAYRNDNYVLDLRGLASQEALQSFGQASDADWVAELTQRNDVPVAMIYDSWFPHIPEEWELVGELELGRSRVSAADNVVAFYATASNKEEILPIALEFSQSLPTGVRFTFQAQE